MHVQSVDCLELFGEEIQPTHSPGMIHTSTPAQVSNHEIKLKLLQSLLNLQTQQH